MPPTPTTAGNGAQRHAMLFELLRQQNRAQEAAAHRPGAVSDDTDETELFQLLAVRSWSSSGMAGRR